MNNSDIKRILFNPNTHKQNFIAQLKLDSSYTDFKKKIKGIKQHPFGKAVLSATPLPKNGSQIRKSLIIPHSGNIEAEIAWLMDSIHINAKSIIKYIDYKKDYEKLFLFDKYDKAEQILNKIENEICFSIWGAENKLLVTEEKSGTESNWLLLDEYSKTIKDPFSLFLIEQSSKKAENKFSYIRYKSNFENIIEGTSNYLHEYLCFRILYPGYTGFQNFSFLINIESVSSIIDRYNLLIDILIELIPIKNKEFLLNVINELNEIIPNDLRLKQISNILSESFTFFPENNGILDVSDSYSRGEFTDCFNVSFEMLKSDPSIIELYIFYVKSSLELKQKYKPTLISKNIDEILLKLYNIFSINENFNSSVEDLLKISLKYFSFNFGKQLFGIISEEANLTNENNIHQLHYVLNSKFNNPKVLSYLNVLKKEDIDRVNNKFRTIDSLSVKINLAINEGNLDFLETNSDISKQRALLYVAKSLVNLKKDKSIIKLLEGRINIKRYSITTIKELIEILFTSYLNEEKVEKALELYINSFFKNHNLVNRLDNGRLLNSLNSIVYTITSIDLPIFYYISTPDIYEQYVRYDEFLESNNIERPTQLFSFSNIQLEKIVFFLKEICNIEVMHHSLYFEGTDDIENERIGILKHLLLIDKENESEYIKEITEITQKTKIRKAIREVNKGRITINSSQLKNKEESNIKDNFIRFKELVVFSKTHSLKSIDPTSKMLNEYFNSLEDKSVREKVVNINDPAFISFKSMFIELRDQFILSKDYGLDGYLSTRIRHGTLLNHIRSVFESYSLISQKKGTEYIQNDYWLKKTPISLSNTKESIQSTIKEFSKNIDEFTEYIIRELIQVKTEKYNQKPNGFFDFSLTDSTLAYLYRESKDSINTHTAFLNFVFEYLEAIIEIKLKDIRHIFRNQIKDEYISRINKFDKEIREIIKNDSFIDLTSSISKCQTDIINELENISEWFNISNPSSDLILDVQTIIKTALEITNTIYPKQTITAIIKDETNLPFGSGTTNLIYIIRILFDNIIKHSGLTKNERNVEIHSKLIENKILKISVLNDFDIKLEKNIKKQLAQIKNNWNKNRNDYSKINIEGGSGFDKIRRILAVDMQIKNYDFDFEIIDNHLTISISMEIRIYKTEQK